MNEKKDSRKYLIGFSLTGSLIMIVFFAFINFSTGSSFPWFIFPAYAALWWPILTIAVGRHSIKMLSLVGSLATIALLVVTNYLTSWSYPWFLFPSFAVLWWPLALFFGVKNRKWFSIAGFIVLAVFFMITNLVVSPAVVWFYDAIFVAAWWPLSVLLAKPGTIKAYSIFGALVILAYLSFKNFTETPLIPWALLTYFPVLAWPASVLLGRRLGKLNTAITGCAAGIVYYTALNITLFPGFPWAIFPAYALLWWPLAIALGKRERMLPFSIISAALTAVLFIVINAITTPGTIWAVYPIFVLAWWPLAIYYFVWRRAAERLNPSAR